MKANELMVDDWVLWKDKPVQIARVSGVVYSFGHIDVTLAHCGNGVLETHDIKSISPIPLTPEILEKNGFNNVIWQGEASWSYHENEVYVCISGRSGGIKHFGYNGWDSKIAIFSVHELQHALKLCGIEKEIIL